MVAVGLLAVLAMGLTSCATVGPTAQASAAERAHGCHGAPVEHAAAGRLSTAAPTVGHPAPVVLPDRPAGAATAAPRMCVTDRAPPLLSRHTAADLQVFRI
ncbi:hypothetical protein AFB00_03575 [Pseudonocardia sp. HH130630-07]|nr:hypothetical protein AFB00_03575 [Pseudonocardia sp. HH130630-07]